MKLLEKAMAWKKSAAENNDSVELDSSLLGKRKSDE